jgi:NAD(P)H dehydrogenase (quinone)
MSIVITAASGQLGQQVVQQLLACSQPTRLVALVRNADRAAPLARAGVEVRIADYNDEAALQRAFRRGDKVLLISGNELGWRTRQHVSVIDAAERAGVALLAYTSILQADRATFQIAQEHVETERALLASGLPYVLLRNGWYNENYTATLARAVTLGAVVGSAGDGAIASASRADYAAAASVVLTTEGHTNKTYELSGDRAWTLTEYAREVSKQTGRTIAYTPIPLEQYRDLLSSAGLPAQKAAAIADSELGVARGELAATPGDLQRLIGRATTPIEVSIAAALAELNSTSSPPPGPHRRGG